MLEPNVLEYLRAAGQMDEARFCKHFNHPVLVSALADLGQAYQNVKTRLSMPVPAGKVLSNPSITALAPVIAVQPATETDAAEIRVGRSEDNDLVLDHETISAQHVVFVRDSSTSRYSLMDLGSTNTTLVNDIQIPPGQTSELSDGDKITIGDCIFVFYYPYGFYRLLRPQPEA